MDGYVVNLDEYLMQIDNVNNIDSERNDIVIMKISASEEKKHSIISQNAKKLDYVSYR